MKIYDSMDILLSRAQQIISQKYKEMLHEFGLTPAQFHVLKCLWEFRNLTPGQLAELTYLDRPTTTKVVDKLYKAGYVERVPDHYDRRSLRVYLTEKGEKIKEPVNSAIESLEKEIIKDICFRNPEISEEEVKEFYNFLHILTGIPDA